MTDSIGPGVFILYALDTGLLGDQIAGHLHPADWDDTVSGYLILDTPMPGSQVQVSKVDLNTLTVVPKTPIPYNIGGLAIANSNSVLSVENLPDGTIYENEVVEDNLLEFTFDTPGPFVIELTNPLYSPTTIEIDVLEP